MGLRRIKTVPIHGINYKDRPQDAEKWLNSMGDPYTRTGADLNGRVSIDWGVYGVPETFVIDAEGRIALRQVGAITPEIYREKIGPLIEKLRRQNSGEPRGIEGDRSNDAVEDHRKQEQK